MITAERVEEILAELWSAGAMWPAVARRLPEYDKLHHGCPEGSGKVRPWVLLRGEHEGWGPIPVRLIRHELGPWFVKGTYAHEIERKARRGNTARTPAGGGRPVPWWER